MYKIENRELAMHEWPNGHSTWRNTGLSVWDSRFNSRRRRWFFNLAGHPKSIYTSQPLYLLLVNFYTFSKVTLCSLSSNYFHKCWSVLYGGIVNGMNGCVCVLSMNNTLDECVREVMNDGQEYTTRALIPSDTLFVFFFFFFFFGSLHPHGR